MSYLGPETYDQEFVQRQFIEILRALEMRNEVQIPEDLVSPRENDVPGDLRTLTDKVNRMLSAMRLQSSARTPLLTLGDGGLGDMVEGLRDAVKRVGNIQGGKGLLVRNTPDGIMLIPTDTQNEFLLPDDSTTITWIKLTTGVTTPDPEDDNQVPYAYGNPVSNKAGDYQDETRTVRVYLPQIGGGTVYLEVDDIVPVQSDLNGDYISQQVGPSTLPAANVPIGGCIVWADVDAEGIPQNVPTGWALCDGTSGTKDMRSAFVVGYDPRNSDYDDARPSVSGGSATVTFASHTVPAHRHNTNTGGTQVTTKGSITSDGAHSTTGGFPASGDHTHTFTSNTEIESGITVGGTGDTAADVAHTHDGETDNEGSHAHNFIETSNGLHSHSNLSFIEDSAHSHTITEEALVTLAHSAQDNRPPWVVAVWIQRIA